MDTELARTFMTVVAAGNFINASERLHVTQSTVSARIRSLEDQLGCTLFVRNKAGTSLTPAGRQFEKHATTLIRTVEQARQDVGIARGFRASLTVGGRFGLWDRLLLKWLPIIRDRAPDISIRAEIGFEEGLMEGLVEGRIDIGVMYTPQSRPGLEVEHLLDETLVLASTERDPLSELGANYIYVDWGPEFYAKHSVQFPDFAGPALSANIGWLGIEHILKSGGTGYFPIRLIRDFLDTGAMVLVPNVPSFTLPAYIVYPEDRDPSVFDIAITAIKEVAVVEYRNVAS